MVRSHRTLRPPYHRTPPPIAPTTWIASHAPWLTHGIAALFIIAAISLIVLLAVQTTKQEGLTGSIGGRVESAYRGRLGAEEQLKRVTGFVAVCLRRFRIHPLAHGHLRPLSTRAAARSQQSADDVPHRRWAGHRRERPFVSLWTPAKRSVSSVNPDPGNR